MRTKLYAFIGAGLIALGAGGALALAGSELSSGSRALEQANTDMHKSMAITMTGDVDVDFVRSMIPHHQGAVDMARIVLEHGSDPEIRKLAEDVISAQETEIAFMNEWLERKGSPEPAGKGADSDTAGHGVH